MHKKKRIAFIYDVCNNLYLVGKGLRELGYDITLYVVDGSSVNTLPESEDPSVAGNYPSWIKSAPQVRLRNMIGYEKYPIIDELNSYDLVVGSREFTMLANIIKSRKIFCISGSDLFVAPFYFNKPARIALRKLSFKVFLGMTIKTYYCRSGIKQCDLSICDQVDVYKEFYLRLLPNPDSLRMTPSYVIIDMDKFQRKMDVTLRDINFSSALDSSLRVFMPSRLLFDPQKSEKETGQWKANDVLIRAFHCLKNKGVGPSEVKLFLIDTVTSRDVQLAKNLVSELGVNEYVVWVSKQDFAPLTKSDMLDVYSLMDVVSDDFGLGWMGSIAVEACATKNVLVTYASRSIPKYGEIPFFSTNDAKEIAGILDKLAKDRIFLKEKAIEGYNWIKKFHGFDALKTSYGRFFDELDY